MLIVTDLGEPLQCNCSRALILDEGRNSFPPKIKKLQCEQMHPSSKGKNSLHFCAPLTARKSVRNAFLIEGQEVFVTT